MDLRRRITELPHHRDFRVDHREALDNLLTQVLAAMMSQNLVTLSRVAQDGTRVRCERWRGVVSP
jgi:hypothetical protein